MRLQRFLLSLWEESSLLASSASVGPIAPLTRHLDCFPAESVRCCGQVRMVPRSPRSQRFRNGDC